MRGVVAAVATQTLRALLPERVGLAAAALAQLMTQLVRQHLAQLILAAVAAVVVVVVVLLQAQAEAAL